MSVRQLNLHEVAAKVKGCDYLACRELAGETLRGCDANIIDPANVESEEVRSREVCATVVECQNCNTVHEYEHL